MKTGKIIITILCIIPFILTMSSFDTYTPEEGSPELKKKKKRKKAVPHNPNLPNILIIGDSISIGYTKTVRSLLKNKANVYHAPGNNQGTTLGLKSLDKWLTFKKGIKWDVIHFNWGLHDLKHVTEAGTSKNSNSFNDPQQADLSTYKKNMEILVKKLKGTKAKLIFATTTPYPNGVKPARKPADAIAYNKAAVEVMKKNDIEVNDLFSVVKDRLKELQRPVNVHFTPKGSKLLGEKVVEKISKSLK